MQYYCLFSALSSRVGVLQMSIIIITWAVTDLKLPHAGTLHKVSSAEVITDDALQLTRSDVCPLWVGLRGHWHGSQWSSVPAALSAGRGRCHTVGIPALTREQVWPSRDWYKALPELVSRGTSDWFCFCSSFSSVKTCCGLCGHRLWTGTAAPHN